MQTYLNPIALRSLGYSSIIFGLLGGILSWWLPMGMVLSIAGLLTGGVGWIMARRESPALALLLSGVVLSVAALVLNIAITVMGSDLIVFH